MSSGTNKQRLDQNNAKIEQLTQALNRKVIGEGNYDTAKGLADGSLTEFVASDFGVTSLASSRFYNFSQLTKLDLRGITNIPDSTARYCTNLSTLILDDNEISVDTRAFEQAGITHLIGKFNNIGTYAFSGNTNSSSDTLTDVNIKINGIIADYAFQGRRKIQNFTLDKNSNITALGSNSFNSFGVNRNNPAFNILTFDLRNSTFKDVQSRTFQGVSAGSKQTYFNIYFPSTLLNLNSNVFTYSRYYNIYYKSIPNLLNTNAFSNATDYKNFFPYNLVQTAKTATNWTSSTNGINASIYGYAEENTFSLGDTLPDTDADGYALTWYSDIGMTTQVTTVSDPTQIYYCSVGSQIKTKLNITQYQAVVTVSDGTNTYTNGDLVPIGSTITITAVGDTGYLDRYIFTLNGTTIASGDTYTVTTDIINIVCAYYDGVNNPFELIFADNTPQQIKTAIDNGFHRILWSVGDTISIILTDNTVATLRLTDTIANRYEKVDGTGYSNAVLEFTSILTTAKVYSRVTGISWAASDINTITMVDIYNLLPQDWQLVISEVKIGSVTSSTDTTIIYANDKCFIPCGEEIYGTAYLNIGPYYYANETLGQFEYYKNKDNTYKIKTYNSTATNWWLRSPIVSNSNGNWCYITTSGTITNNGVTIVNGVSPCFAI